MTHTEQDVDDDICRSLRQQGVPVTRHNRIKMACGNDVPDPWTWDQEEELPETLQAPFGHDGPPQPVHRPCDR